MAVIGLVMQPHIYEPGRCQVPTQRSQGKEAQLERRTRPSMKDQVPEFLL